MPCRACWFAETRKVCILYTKGRAVNGPNRWKSPSMTVDLRNRFCRPDRNRCIRRRHGAAARALPTLPGLAWLDLYAPAAEASTILMCKDGPPPAHLAMLAFASSETLAQAASTPAFAAGFVGSERCELYGDALRALSVVGESTAAPLSGAVFLCRALSSPGRRRGGVRQTLSARPSAAARPAAGRPQRGQLCSAALAPCRRDRRRPTTCLATRRVRDAAPSTRRWLRPCGTSCARTIVRCRASPAATRISPWIGRAWRADRHRVPMRHRASVTTNQVANRANTALSVVA